MLGHHSGGHDKKMEVIVDGSQQTGESDIIWMVIEKTDLSR